MTRLCVIFDIDGTLCDTNAVDDECYRESAAVTLDVAPAQTDWTDAPIVVPDYADLDVLETPWLYGS